LELRNLTTDVQKTSTVDYICSAVWLIVVGYSPRPTSFLQQYGITA
jgi:hypothetical protein